MRNITIEDLNETIDLDEEVMASIQGGRIKLDPDAEETAAERRHGNPESTVNVPYPAAGI